MKRYALREYDIEIISKMISHYCSIIIDKIQFLLAHGCSEEDPIIISLEEDLDCLRILMKKLDL